MPDATPQAPQTPPYPYKLRFEAVGAFSVDELFVKGLVRGKIWVTDTVSVVFQSLTGDQVNEINQAVQVREDTTVAKYNTEITYHNLARAMVEFVEKPFTGTVDEKFKKVCGMAGPILARLSLAYLEFGMHVDELFSLKEGLAKKS